MGQGRGGGVEGKSRGLPFPKGPCGGLVPKVSWGVTGNMWRADPGARALGVIRHPRPVGPKRVGDPLVRALGSRLGLPAWRLRPAQVPPLPHTPDSLPLPRSGNLPQLPLHWTLPGDPQVPLPL